MNYKILVNKKIWKSWWIILPASLFVSYYYFNNMDLYNGMAGGKSFQLGELFLVMYGSLEPGLIKQVLPLLMLLYPLFLLVYYLGNDIQDFYKSNAKYIFTRTQNRMKWSVIYLLRLFISIIVFYFIQDIGTLAVGLVKGARVSCGDFKILFSVFLIQLAAGFFLLLILNLSAVLLGMTYSYILVFSICLFSFTVTGLISEYAPGIVEFTKWLPTSQFILGWHQENFTFAFTSIYLLVGFVILITAFLVLTDRMYIN